MESKNLGILVAPPRPTDYIAGINSPISVTQITVKDWSIYLPNIESQRNKITDFLDCVSMSAIHSIECKLNYFLSNNKFSDEALFFFHNNGYINNGSFHLSARFTAKLNGTDKTKGQQLNIGADCIRRDGLLPFQDLPMNDEMTWEEYYTDIIPSFVSKAKKIFWFIDIKYQWINRSDFSIFLPSSPIQVATEICSGWDSGKTVQKCSGQPLQHATIIYGKSDLGEYLNFDHYPPYMQMLSWDYELPLNLQYIVTLKPITLRNGMYGSNVLQLQKDLNKLGYNLMEDSSFGYKTETAVRNIQNKTDLAPDGIAGPLTRSKIQKLIEPKSVLEAIILVESGGDDKAIGDKNLENHAYGCLQIRQGVCDDVNRVFGTNYKATDCLDNREVSLDIWNKYWQVYPNIITNEDKARTWNGGPNWKKIYFKENKTPEDIIYCRNLDIYWTKVFNITN